MDPEDTARLVKEVTTLLLEISNEKERQELQLLVGLSGTNPNDESIATKTQSTTEEHSGESNPSSRKRTAENPEQLLEEGTITKKEKRENFSRPDSSSSPLEFWQEINMLRIRNPFPIISELPTFTNVETLNPVRFLERLDSFLSLNKIPIPNRLAVAKSALRGDASTWAEFQGRDWLTYDDFSVSFLEFFWSVGRQRIERRRLSRKNFGSDRLLSMAVFFMQQVNSYRLFIPRMPDKIILQEVMQQFPPSIRSLWVAGCEKTLQATASFLEQQDEIFSEHQD